MLDMGFRTMLKINAVARAAAGHHDIGHDESPGAGDDQQFPLRTPRSIAVSAARQPHCTIAHQVMLADGQEHKDKLLPALLKGRLPARAGVRQQAQHRGAPCRAC